MLLYVERSEVELAVCIEADSYHLPVLAIFAAVVPCGSGAAPTNCLLLVKPTSEKAGVEREEGAFNQKLQLAKPTHVSAILRTQRPRAAASVGPTGAVV